MPDITFQPAIRHELNGNQQTFGAGSTLNYEPGHLITTSEGIGTALVDAAVVVLESLKTLHRTLFTFTAKVIATVDHTTNGGNATLPLYTFPRGNIQILGASSNLALTGDGTGVTTTAAVVGAIGTVVAASDATLTSTEANIIPSTVCTLTASAGVMKGKPTTALSVDNTTTTNSTQMTANLNFAIPDAGSTAAGTITVTGTLEIIWANYGDS